MPSRRRAIVFDLDGLMVDTEPLSHLAWARMMAAFDQVLDDATYNRMIGRRIEVSAQIVLETFPIPLTVAEIIDRKEAIFHNIRAKGVPAMPGLMKLQREIARQKIPWAVATASPRQHAMIILEQLGLAASCGAIAAGDEVPLGKPAPDVYLLASDRLGVPPDQCLALEDSAPGCHAALAAGMRVVAIPNGQTSSAHFPPVHRFHGSLHDVMANLESLLRFED
jgi:HAD superfamily hydrolase (TIGR01509 family)